MKVLVDSREREKSNIMIKYWERNAIKLPHITSMEVKELDVSDTCTDDMFIGIERKSQHDFIPSICSGKLRQQLYELRQNFDVPVLVVEGYDGLMDCITKTPQVHPNVIIGASTSAFAHNRVPIFYVGAFYVPFVLNLIDKMYDGKEMTPSTYNPVRAMPTQDDYVRYLVYGLPGVKGEIGERLLKHFDYSISKILAASVEELITIPGIGKKKADEIKGVLK